MQHLSYAPETVMIINQVDALMTAFMNKDKETWKSVKKLNEQPSLHKQPQMHWISQQLHNNTDNMEIPHLLNGL